ncbi:uncharacterized protein LOC135925642 isoform X5 [Gordionus sp. m RMFG-2023]|uniref:uncharacterized protein LOC135925642 isoform X4 n=1 Tax=Gordionus sp. m RMFG-2023 TaxID=3053472 RepID=UPI0031FC0D20
MPLLLKMQIQYNLQATLLRQSHAFAAENQIQYNPQATLLRQSHAFAAENANSIQSPSNSLLRQSHAFAAENDDDYQIDVANTLIDLHQYSHSPRFIKSQQGKTLLFYNKFLYRIDHKKDLIIYYRCRNKSCKGRCKFDGTYSITCLYSHQHETYFYEKLRTKEVLEMVVAENPLETRLAIYEKAMVIRCSENLDIADYPEVIPSFVSIKTTIDRIIKKYRPMLPHSVKDIHLTPEYTLTNWGCYFHFS